MRIVRTAALTAAVALAACLGVTDAGAVDKVFRTEKATVTVKTFARGLDQPWGLAFLPDGRMLVTEKEGNLRIVSADGKLSDPLRGVPKVDQRGQGGLLDVALDPNFAQNRLVYLSFSEPGTGTTNSTAVARGTLSADGRALENVQVIFSQKPKVPSRMHYGSRLVFDRQGHLYVTLGERSEERYRTQAQDLNSHLGKVVRINPDGSVPADNPFVSGPFANKPGALPEIWSYGHRNMQGAALNPQTGALGTNELGPRGGDEINRPEPGRNYGWPVISYGKHYSGAEIGEGAVKEGFEQPLHYWDPSIAPGAIAVYRGDMFPEWDGDYLVAALKYNLLARLERDDSGAVIAEERLFQGDYGRMRDVKVAPDGSILILTDSDNGLLLRVTDPASQ